MMIATMSFAQNTLVATLTHDDDISIYYGINAFKDAMTAAADGDVINLSGGKFNYVNITKAVTIRGIGVEEENPTILDGFGVNIPASDAHHLTMEGIRTSGDVSIKGSTTNPYFLKCDFNFFTVEDNAQHVMVMSCDIGYLRTFANSSSQFINSNAFVSNTPAASTEFINCLLRMNYCNAKDLNNCNIVNSVIVGYVYGYYSSFDSFPASTIPVNCISVGPGNPFANTTGTNNVCGLDNSIFIDSNPLKDLTDEAKSKYLGYDDTPVGMYGGIMPKNMVPSYPRITKMNVAKQTTADGKLSVDIEVSAAE